MPLDRFTLDVLHCIRLNGYEVRTTSSGHATLITIVKLERNAETSIALTQENRYGLVERLMADYCTPLQQESLALSASSLLLRVA